MSKTKRPKSTKKTNDKKNVLCCAASGKIDRAHWGSIFLPWKVARKRSEVKKAHQKSEVIAKRPKTNVATNERIKRCDIEKSE